MEDRRLLAQPFDDRRLRLDGSPTVVAEDVGYLGFWGSFSVSRTGAVAWRGDETAGSVRWFESTGDEWAPGAIRDLYAPRNPRLSPDGRRLALVVAGDIWVFDLDGRPPIRLTFDDFTNATPLWTPDGAHIVYEADGGLAWTSADGASPPEPVGSSRPRTTSRRTAVSSPSRSDAVPAISVLLNWPGLFRPAGGEN